ncbi:cytochrome P450 [Amycolatopsis sp. K13G38]|uniref:Cytochrome P450 n=1 Tax=Amycolatopsis acididurans TaxID=2724524 RepID=A0ABX1J2H4_9PSEU|nr:cytochrome P450 [Amycolatopsis acididurans]NKQ53997.1 cytochrome P450 [Amycolatopsis acididurans]
MTEARALDRDRIKTLFDLRSSFNSRSGGDVTGDPYPAWRRLREQAAVHEGTVHELTGYPGDYVFQGLPEPDRPHFSAFSYGALDTVYRNPQVFSSSSEPVDLDGEPAATNSMLSMGGRQHRRYRALVQPSFVPARAHWWIDNWISSTVHALIDGFVADGHAELNVDFCAAIPVLTITGSFGIAPEQALDLRAALDKPHEVVRMIQPIVAARREEPADDLISVLVQAELTDENGVTHRLSDAEVNSFALLLLAAGSGTTWKQMGITLTALLQRPELLARIREDRSLLKPATEEALRWMPTDPMFSRYVTRDTELEGVPLPEGAVVHLCLGAANRDPARWQRPDEYDIARKVRASFAFGGGPHICLGMHVARAEISTGIGALLDRLPGLRLDPGAEPPRYIGMYERGVTEIPVLFDR